MNDIWNEIVEALSPYLSHHSSESDYQRKIEECFRYIGWKSSNGTMKSQYAVPIGNSNTIRPDLVLFNVVGNAVLPVEIKRPDNVQKERQVTQLKTYVRQLNLRVGLYIGENIQLYYNSENGDFANVFTAEISKDDANGPILCGLLSFPEFDLEKLCDFCISRYKQIQARNNLYRRLSEFFAPDEAVQNTMSLFKEKFVTEGYDPKSVEEELSYLHVSVNYIPAYERAAKSEVEPGLKHDDTDSEAKVGNRETPEYISSTHDNTRFSFNGSPFYPKRVFVLAVIKQYVLDHPNVTFEELREVFPDTLHSKTLRVVRKAEDVKMEMARRPDLAKRYFIEPKDIISLSDGTKVVVNNQWGPTFRRFLDVAKCLYDVKSDKPYNI